MGSLPGCIAGSWPVTPWQEAVAPGALHRRSREKRAEGGIVEPGERREIVGARGSNPERFSKGGGAATYAFVAVALSAKASREQAERMRCVTFNAAVVKERNWRRLFRRLDPDADPSRKEPAAGSIAAGLGSLA